MCNGTLELSSYKNEKKNQIKTSLYWELKEIIMIAKWTRPENNSLAWSAFVRRSAKLFASKK